MQLVHCDFKSETSHFHLKELQSKALSAVFNTMKPIGVFLITATVITISLIYRAFLNQSYKVFSKDSRHNENIKQAYYKIVSKGEKLNGSNTFKT